MTTDVAVIEMVLETLTNAVTALMNAVRLLPSGSDDVQGRLDVAAQWLAEAERYRKEIGGENGEGGR